MANNLSPNLRLFAGTFEHTLDPAKRIVIPSEWRREGGEKLFVIPRQEGRMAVLPEEEMNRLAEQIQTAPNTNEAERRILSLDLFSRTTPLGCDKLGRITIGAELMKHAGLQNTVVLVGVGKRFEIWNPKAWAEQQQEASDSGRINATLDQYGI